jgi:hypothetical protein
MVWDILVDPTKGAASWHTDCWPVRDRALAVSEGGEAQSLVLMLEIFSTTETRRSQYDEAHPHPARQEMVKVRHPGTGA